eukprot:CAMPEP_0197028120 /NCGR_PEP_ID=MMETSP1384-20130603/7892_1 /TAXON_ID=29189 /ORGANISM="Ammonia sp." /LENGTH=642 /DNA_ID=CAMNT_0042457073 /DNA_START=34 /DNA_END=1962 /DNA_ORIENTATION=-
MMQPLVTARERTSSSSSATTTKPSIWCKSLCVVAALLVIALLCAVGYFGAGQSLDSRSPAKSLAKKRKQEQTLEAKDISLPNKDYDSFYPSKLEVDPNRVIVASDSSAASVYYNSDGADDLITSMPGLVEATCSASPTNCQFEQYSGYLLANDNREIHYWFIQAEHLPHKKPVFIWTNGGPGCSGMDGLLTEHGPWKAMADNKIAYNPYAWNTEVNMVYLEQPYGVGFSTVDEGQSVVGGDQNAADDMDAAIRDFINKFPAFAENEFYLSSESWGGHYVPITTYTILQNNENGATPHINLKGFLLGNPSTDSYENTYGFVGDIYGHGMVKSSDWYTWRDKCWGNAEAIDTETVCSAIYARAYYSAFNANVYALDFPQCYIDESWSDDRMINSPNFMKAAHLHRSAQKSMKKVLESKDYASLKMGHIQKEELQKLHDKIEARLSMQSRSKEQKSMLKANDKGMKEFALKQDDSDSSTLDVHAYEPCIEHEMTSWLNQEVVQTALHVKPTEWELCSDAVWYAWPDSDFEAHIEPYYTHIVDEYVDRLGLTLTVYSGDDDSVCGLQGTMYWLDRWGQEVNSDVEWQEWSDDGSQLGGYYTQYLDSNGNVALHFITVRSAGHMVPTTQPARALKLLQTYLGFTEDS